MLVLALLLGCKGPDGDSGDSAPPDSEVETDLDTDPVETDLPAFELVVVAAEPDPGPTADHALMPIADCSAYYDALAAQWSRWWVWRAHHFNAWDGSASCEDPPWYPDFPDGTDPEDYGAFPDPAQRVLGVDFDDQRAVVVGGEVAELRVVDIRGEVPVITARIALTEGSTPDSVVIVGTDALVFDVGDESTHIWDIDLAGSTVRSESVVDRLRTRQIRRVGDAVWLGGTIAAPDIDARLEATMGGEPEPGCTGTAAEREVAMDEAYARVYPAIRAELDALPAYSVLPNIDRAPVLACETMFDHQGLGAFEATVALRVAPGQPIAGFGTSANATRTGFAFDADGAVLVSDSWYWDPDEPAARADVWRFSLDGPAVTTTAWRSVPGNVLSSAAVALQADRLVVVGTDTHPGGSSRVTVLDPLTLQVDGDLGGIGPDARFDPRIVGDTAFLLGHAGDAATHPGHLGVIPVDLASMQAGDVFAADGWDGLVSTWRMWGDPPATSFGVTLDDAGREALQPSAWKRALIDGDRVFVPVHSHDDHGIGIQGIWAIGPRGELGLLDHAPMAAQSECVVHQGDECVEEYDAVVLGSKIRSDGALVVVSRYGVTVSASDALSEPVGTVLFQPD